MTECITGEHHEDPAYRLKHSGGGFRYPPSFRRNREENKEQYPNAQVTYRDVVHQPITHLTADIAAGFRPVGGADSQQAQPEHQVSQALVDEFLAHELIILVRQCITSPFPPS